MELSTFSYIYTNTVNMLFLSCIGAKQDLKFLDDYFSFRKIEGLIPIREFID